MSYLQYIDAVLHYSILQGTFAGKFNPIEEMIESVSRKDSFNNKAAMI